MRYRWGQPASREPDLLRLQRARKLEMRARRRSYLLKTGHYRRRSIGGRMANLLPHCGYVAKNHSGARFAAPRGISALAEAIGLSQNLGDRLLWLSPAKGGISATLGLPAPLKFRRPWVSSNQSPGAQKGHRTEPFCASWGPLFVIDDRHSSVIPIWDQRLPRSRYAFAECPVLTTYGRRATSL